MASRICHSAARSSFSFSRWMVTRARGSAINVRIERMVAATISSSSVKPVALVVLGPRWNFFVLILSSSLITRFLLLNRDGGLRSVDGDGLQSRITGSSTSDGQGSLSIGLRLERECDDRALSGNSSGARGTRRRNLRLSDGLIFAMNKCYGLAVLR